MHQLGNGISGASQAGCIAPVNGGGISSVPRTTPKGKPSKLYKWIVSSYFNSLGVLLGYVFL